MKTIIALILITLLSYMGIAGALYAFQRDLLYAPTQKYLHPFDKLKVTSDAETINLIVLNKGNRKALIYFGGNGEAVIANAEKFSKTFPDLTIYLVNYRGYGGSSGKPTELGLFKDALCVYDTIKEKHDNISAAGRSLGSGVATYLAEKRTLKSLVLITPYDSMLKIVQNKFPFFPIKLLLKDHYNSLSRAKKISEDILVIAAEFDQVIPMTHTQNLINSFQENQVQLHVIKQSGHNSLSNHIDYYEALRDFL